MDNYLNRRAAFWDNWRLQFKYDIEHFAAESAGRPFDENDRSEINAVLVLLKNIEFITMSKFHKVLGEQLETFSDVNSEANHE